MNTTTKKKIQMIIINKWIPVPIPNKIHILSSILFKFAFVTSRIYFYATKSILFVFFFLYNIH